MRLTIQAKPNSKHPGVEKTGEHAYRVAVREPAQDGRANEAVVHTIAKYLDIPPSRVRIIRGSRGQRKVVEVER